jgi:hypothetical protein
MKYGIPRGTVVRPCAHHDTKSRGAFKPVPKPRPKFEVRLLRHPLNLGAVTMEKDGMMTSSRSRGLAVEEGDGGNAGG